MTRKKTHWLRNTIIIMLLFCIAGLILTSVVFFGNPDPTYATANIEFAFEGAADGLAPNGALFNISDITSDEVLTTALEACALQEAYTVDQIRECLVARGVYPDNMVEKVKAYESVLDTSADHEASISEYHPTTYNIELYNSFDKAITQNQLMELLKAIVTTYKDHFSRVYANGLKKDDPIASLSEYDYPQQLEILESYFNTVVAYAQEMYARRPAFRYENEAFSDISVRLNSLINSEVARIKADMTLNGISRNAGRLKDQYEFEITDLRNRQENQKLFLNRLDNLIESYEKNSIIYVSSGSSMNKIDNNSNITYDTLISQRTEASDGVAQINAQATAYQQQLDDLTGIAEFTSAQDADVANETVDAAQTADSEPTAAVSDAETAILERSIQALAEKGMAYVDQFKAMLKAFNAEEINDQTVTVARYAYKTPQILSGAFAMAAIKIAGPICAIGFMLCMVLIILSLRKETKVNTERR